MTFVPLTPEIQCVRTFILFNKNVHLGCGRTCKSGMIVGISLNDHDFKISLCMTILF